MEANASRVHVPKAASHAPSRFGFMATPRAVFLLAGLWACLALLFHVIPQIDISLASAFFDRAAFDNGRTMHIELFPLNRDPVLSFFRYAAKWTIGICLAGVIVATFVGLYQGRWFADRLQQAYLTLLGAFFLGPVVFANLVTKAWMGRPRPRQIELFGGDLPFVPAATYSEHCQGNCSFVSGEAASVFWLLGLVVFVPSAYRPVVLVVLATFAAFIAMLRVGLGAHFLSDVMLGGLSTLVFMALVAWALDAYGRTPGAGRSPFT